MNYSKQRAAIMNVLKQTTVHPSAEYVYNEVRKEIPNISLGTVYRNLKQLEQSGEVVRVFGTFEKERYDGNTMLHAHFVCDNCQKVTDITIPVQLARDILALSPDARTFTLNFSGLCPDCK